jgi:O-antigen ligase
MIRRRMTLGAFCLLVVGSALGGLGVLDARGNLARGWVDATTTFDLPYRIPLAGVNAELVQYTPEELDRNLNLMAEAGLTWVRQFFPWPEIEPTPGEFDWGPWDAIVEATRAHGLELVAVLDDSPAWSRSQGEEYAGLSFLPPADADDFAAFARAFAARYGEVIGIYQIWDEPNLESHWGALPPEPANYVNLLCAAHRAIHAADETATVLAAALAPTTETGPDNLSDTLYLRTMYGHGAQDCFDGAAGKPYGFDSGPYDRRVDESLLNFSRVIMLREIMVEHGDGQKPLWGSNFGWNYLPEDWAGLPSIWGAVSAEDQVRYTAEAYARARDEWPWLGGLILHHWQPDAPPGDARWGFAVVGHDDRPAELLGAFPSLPSAAIPGRYPAVNPYSEYSGEWHFSEFGGDMGTAGDSEFTFAFSGSALALELRRYFYNAYFFVTVDGRPANALPKDADGRAYIVLNSPDYTHTTDLVAVARGGDPSKPHSAHVTGQASWGGQWVLGGFRVGTPPDLTGYDAALLALAAAGLVGAAGVIARRADIPSLIPFRRLSATIDRWPLARLAATAVTSILLLLGLFCTWGGALPNVVRRAGETPTLLIIALSAGLLYFSPALLIALLSAAVLFFLIYQRLEYGLALVVFWAPFYLFPVELFANRHFSMAEVTLLITGVAWTARGLTSWAERGSRWPRVRLSLTLADWVMLALVILSAVAVTWSAFRVEALRELRVVIVEPALFYLMLRTTSLKRRDDHRDWWLMDALILAGVVVAVCGLYQYIFNVQVIIAEQGARRLTSVYGSPNNVAMYLGGCLALILAVVLMGRERTRRIAYLAAGVVILPAAALTQSMGYLLLGLPASVIAILLLWRGRRALPILVVLGVLAALALVPLSHLPRFARLTDISTGTTFIRLQLWRSTLALIQEHPLTGVGPDQFLYQYRSRYILPSAWEEPNLAHTHNYLLDHWARLGVLGVGIALGVQFAFWRSAWRAHRWLRVVDPSTAALAAGLMGAMAHFMAHGLVDSPFFMLDLNYVFALMLALATRYSARATRYS